MFHTLIIFLQTLKISQSLPLVLYFFCIMITVPSFSQTNKSSHLELGVVTGPWLPSNYSKLSEILSLTGVKGSFGFGAFRHELNYLSGRGKGLEVNMFTWAVRNDIEIITELDLFWLAGLHYMNFQPKYQGFDYVLPRETANGWFFGFGTDMGGQRIIGRAEFSLAMRPGRHLFVGLGVIFKLGSLSEQNTLATNKNE